MPKDFDVISRHDLKEKMDRGDDFQLVEVLSPPAYENAHLPDAINIPGDSIRKDAADRLPRKDRDIVVYCASPSCRASPRAAAVLSDMGYTHVMDYAGGKEHWREGGLPLVEDGGKEA